jgi:2-amino-4-hydroxy-6-hydroxymethyldihydropteridine diphosphokinase
VDHVRRVVIGLGANLGDREANLKAAIDALRADADLFVLRRSPVYETAPVGGPPQADYLNAAVLIVTALPARELLARAIAIEERLGRVRPDPVRWGPRTIDLDLLWIEGEAIDEPDLCVPHRLLCVRPFALRPLVDVAPDAADPRNNEPLGALEAASTELRRFAP